MDKKNLGIVLSIFGGGIGLIGLVSGGILAMLVLLVVYYFAVGFTLTEITDLVENPVTWLMDLFKDE